MLQKKKEMQNAINISKQILFPSQTLKSITIPISNDACSVTQAAKPHLLVIDTSSFFKGDWPFRC